MKNLGLQRRWAGRGDPVDRTAARLLMRGQKGIKMREYDHVDDLGNRERVKAKVRPTGWAELEDGRVVQARALRLPPDHPDYCDRCGGPH